MCQRLSRDSRLPCLGPSGSANQTSNMHLLLALVRKKKFQSLHQSCPLRGKPILFPLQHLFCHLSAPTSSLLILPFKVQPGEATGTRTTRLKRERERGREREGDRERERERRNERAREKKKRERERGGSQPGCPKSL